MKKRKQKGIALMGCGIMLQVSLLLMLPHTLSAQQQKSPLPKELYGRFSELSLSSLSGDGRWIAYNLSYPKGDTLCIQATSGTGLYKLAGARQPAFVAGEAFAAILPGNSLRLLNLKKGKEITIPNVVEFRISENRRYIVAIATDRSALRLIDCLSGKTVLTVTDIQEYALSQRGNRLAYVRPGEGRSRLSVLDLESDTPTEETISLTDKGEPCRLVWHKNGKALAYCSRNREHDTITAMALYDQKQKSEAYWYPPPGQGWTASRVARLSVTDDAARVLVALHAREQPLNEGPEVWNGNAKWLYPLNRIMASERGQQSFLWKPGSNPVPVNDSLLPVMRLTGRQQYALLHNPERYAPQNLLEPETDFYVKNLETGKTELLAAGMTTAQGWLSLSPYSDDIAYYNGKQWWVFHPATGQRHCLSAGIRTRWDNAGTNAMPPVKPYGFAGWTSGGRYALIYDGSDIWKIPVAGGSAKRLTRGAESGWVYRIAQTAFNDIIHQGRNAESLFLEGISRNDNSEDYFLYLSNGELHRISPSAGLSRQLRTTSDGKAAFIRERYDTPPGIYYLPDGRKGKKAEKITATNTLQDKYCWGHSELISYRTEHGTGKAALFYPSEYQAGKRYPMITYIYDELSYRLHHYVTPLQSSAVGFNITQYTLNGYLVLLPDITYREGAPGHSACGWVTAAVDRVVEMGLADPKAVGLMGTSFGGYETGFILTQTNKFAAGVAGAGIYDLPSFYFSMGGDLLRTEAWRFESQIFRMGFPYFENQQAYEANSPLQQAANLETPLLLWCGKQDGVVSWQQSLLFYSALRGLGKKTVMLVYPDEYHALAAPDNRNDLSLRVRQWFDHFLRGKEAAWITAGTKPPQHKK